MKILVVYDSYFGNTEKVAEAIGGVLKKDGDVRVARSSDVDSTDMEGLDYLIAGSPTRQFSPTEGIKKFISGLPRGGLKGIKTAAFDTRMAVEDVDSGMLRFMVGIFGYAAKSIAGKLRKRGGEEIAAPEGFFVSGMEGPLKDGELERAREWAVGIVEG